MGFSESDHGCKTHPQHQQKQGVCPSCLIERLSRLCSTSYNEASRVAPSLSYSPADYFSAASSSNPASPARHRISHQRNGSRGVMGIMGSSSFMVKVGTNYGLKKSRSIAFVPRKFDDDEEVKIIGKKKKGFWSKVLRLKEKKDVLKHSISMRMIERIF